MSPSWSTMLSWTVFVWAITTFPALFFIVAPYGRHARPGWGPTIPARVAWFIMEAPALFLFLGFWLTLPSFGGLVTTALGLAWAIHYAQRTFVYTARMRPGGVGKPLFTVTLAILFNVVNATGNATQLTERTPDLALVAGLALFVLGFAINVHSDAVLRALRKPGESGYAIPQGGLHRLVASPNYFGEIVEWLGFAIAAQTLAGWAFLAFTCANLLPRARSHLQWYRSKFPDYPSNRRAVFPYLW